MLDDKISRIVARVLIAIFVFGSIACYPAFLLSPFGKPAVAHLWLTTGGEVPDEGPPISGGMPMTEDISDVPVSELIHPPAWSVPLLLRGPGVYHPSEPPSAYAADCFCELLRPPQM